MKFLKTKYYIVRRSQTNKDSFEIVGGPFDKLYETAPHLNVVGAEDLEVLSGAILNLPLLRVQDKRPKTDEEST